MSSTHQRLVPPGGWRGPGHARITPITDAERGMISGLVDWGTRRIGKLEPRNIFLTLQRAPRLFWPWMLFVTRLMPYGKIHAHDRERVILRVAWLCRSEYEWGQHVQISGRIGLPSAELPWIAEGPAAPQWPDHQRLLMQAVNEFHADRFVTDATWNALAATYPPDVMIELMMLIGHYEMLAGVLNSVGVEMEG
ncbi:MAG: carboxymuconolactone decarboxylase family protein [Gammaproteobacteria bacterium]